MIPHFHVELIFAAFYQMRCKRSICRSWTFPEAQQPRPAEKLQFAAIRRIEGWLQGVY
jgi:hypothetical protein